MGNMMMMNDSQRLMAEEQCGLTADICNIMQIARQDMLLKEKDRAAQWA
jgi:hypothetical protein